MSLDFETEDLSGLSHEQAVALLGALLLAAMKQPEIDDATIKRFQDAAAALPWVLNQHVVDELVEEARARYSGADPSQSSTFVGEIAALITDPVLREKTLMAMQRAEVRDFLHEYDPGVLGDAITAFGITSERLAQIQQQLDAASQASAAPPTTNADA